MSCPCTNYWNATLLVYFNIFNVFSSYLLPQWPLQPDHQTLFRTFFRWTLGKVLFLLTDVSLSLALSETLWKVAAVSEVQPRSVLINHSPVTLFSTLSLSIPLPLSLRPFHYLSKRAAFPLSRHSLSLSLPFTFPLSACLSLSLPAANLSVPLLPSPAPPRFNT